MERRSEKMQTKQTWPCMADATSRRKHRGCPQKHTRMAPCDGVGKPRDVWRTPLEPSSMVKKHCMALVTVTEWLRSMGMFFLLAIPIPFPALQQFRWLGNPRWSWCIKSPSTLHLSSECHNYSAQTQKQNMKKTCTSWAFHAPLMHRHLLLLLVFMISFRACKMQLCIYSLKER